MSKKLKKIQNTNKNEWVFGTVLILLCILIYGLTVHPSIPTGDSSELILVAHTLGVAHPPGYPLFTLIGYLFNLIPLGGIAFRVNCVSAFFDILAVLLLFLSLTRRTQNQWSAFLACGLFAFSPLVWTYATVAEVFALNNFFCAGLFYLSIRFYEKPEIKWLYYFSFWVALGLTNHHTLIFYGFPILLWMSWILRKEVFKFKTIAKTKLLFLAGLLPYLYLPWSSSRSPLVSWGDQTHWIGFLVHLLRMGYGTFKLKVLDSGGDWNFFIHIFNWFGTLFKEWIGIGAIFCGIGIREQFKRENRNSLNLIWLGSTFCYIVVFSLLSGGNLKDELSWSIQARFYQQSFLILCLGTAIGFDKVFQKYPRFQNSLAPLLCGWMMTTQILSHYSRQNHPDAEDNRKVGIDVLINLPVQAILITQGDQSAPTFRYLQMVENFRPDIRVIDQNMLIFAWSKKWLERNFSDIVLPLNGIYSPFRDRPMYSPQGFTMKDFIDANLPRHPIFDFNGFRDNETSYEASYEAWPWGLTWVILPRGVKPDLKEWMAANETVFNGGSWGQSVKETYQLGSKSYGSRIMQLGVQEKNLDQVRRGVGILEKISDSDELQDLNFYHNLGIGYFYLAPSDLKAKAGLIKAWKKYLSLNPPESLETESIRSTLKKAEMN